MERAWSVFDTLISLMQAERAALHELSIFSQVDELKTDFAGSKNIHIPFPL